MVGSINNQSPFRIQSLMKPGESLSVTGGTQIQGVI
jgi:hypothetical protein